MQMGMLSHISYSCLSSSNRTELTAFLEVAELVSTTTQICSCVVFLTSSKSVIQSLLLPTEGLKRDTVQMLSRVEVVVAQWSHHTVVCWGK